jgi:hypothetical protein
MSRSARHHHSCKTTGKRRFRDHLEVTRALQKSANARSRATQDGATCHRREVRAYECEACHGWHLTSWAHPHPAAAWAPAA